MPTTTNYSWTTPADTDLVKDGASAIRSLGTAIDTTTKNLNPSTTAGDIEYRSSTTNVNTRLPLGTAGQVLKVNSGATAPEWGTISSGLTLIANQTVSSSTTINVNDVFSASYENYLVVAVLFGGGGQTGSMRLRVGGSDNSTASSYRYSRIDVASGNVTAATVTDTSWSGMFLSADNMAWQRCFFYRPFEAAWTGIDTNSAINGDEIHITGGRHNQTVSYTGFTFIWSSAVSGEIKVYGLAE